MTIAQILQNQLATAVSDLKAWVVFNRGNNKIRFLTINDGSTFANLQVVLKAELATTFEKARLGAAISVSGLIALTPQAAQPLELVASEAEILKNTDLDYPLQRQEMSREALREVPHLRHRTQLISAVMRVRSALTVAVHQWFNQAGFINVVAPIITSNDGEGAGEAFVVDSPAGNFFGKKATLGVTGQLQAEAYANGFGKVYTFAPTFRAEESHTTRHLAEFWMIEPEMAFGTQREAINVADELVRYCLNYVLKNCALELAHLNELSSKTLLPRLKHFLNHKLTILDYRDAIVQLTKVQTQFKEQNIHFGMDLATEHERYLAETFVGGPVAVINYPRALKAFYMKQNDDNATVACFDILVPGIGELVGGSARETDLNKLTKRMQELKLPLADLQWYLDLRRFGQAASAGFGLGFERLVMYVTGIENIREVIAFPRTPNNLLM